MNPHRRPDPGVLAHWFDVARLELPDGRIARIQETGIRLSPRYVCFYNKWDPGAITPRHGHHGDHSILVVKGQVSDGVHVCGPGSHIMLEYGDTFGPGRPDRTDARCTA